MALFPESFDYTAMSENTPLLFHTFIYTHLY